MLQGRRVVGLGREGSRHGISGCVTPLWVTGAVSGLSFGEQWQLSSQKEQWSQDICLVKADAQMERMEPKEGH